MSGYSYDRREYDQCSERPEHRGVVHGGGGFFAFFFFCRNDLSKAADWPRHRLVRMSCVSCPYQPHKPFFPRCLARGGRSIFVGACVVMALGLTLTFAGTTKASLITQVSRVVLQSVYLE